MKNALNQIFLTLLFLGSLQIPKAYAQDLTIDPGTITFEEGSYMGGDVIRRFRLRVTNVLDPDAEKHTVTSYRVEVHLSKDGLYNDVSNAQDDFALHVLNGGPIGPNQSQEFTWNQLAPYNVEGQLFVVAKVTTVLGPVDSNLENNTYKPTQGARLNLIPTKGFDAGLISKTTGGLAPAGFSDSPSLSSDARYVAYTSTARDLSFTNGVKSTDYSDIYIHDRITNTTRRASISSSGIEANGNSFRPSISPDGNLVVFHSDASNLVANDTNLVSDVFIHDKRTGQTLRVSSPDAEMLLLNSGNTQSNGPSYNATISTSAAGIFVVYESLAENLTRRSVTGAIVPDTNRSQDIFLYDLSTSKTTRVNINDLGVQASNINPRLNADSYGARISRDGRSIVFRSEATNLVSNDTNGLSDVFVFNRSVNGAIALDQPLNTSLRRINLRIDQNTGIGAQATRDVLLGGSFPDRGSSYFPDLSSNGRYIVYASEASNLSGTPASISVEYGLPGSVSVQITGLPRMKRLNPSGVIDNAKATPTVTVNNGIGLTTTFEFVDNQAADPSNIEVAVASSDTEAIIAANLATAINLKISSITAVAVGNTVTLIHKQAGYTPSISSELDAKVSPSTVIQAADLNLNPGDTITVNDGITTKIFEAVQFGSVAAPGNIPFAIGVNDETTKDFLIGAINQANMNVVARVDASFFNGGQAVSVISKQIGPAPAGFAVSVSSLLSYSPQQQKITAGTTSINNGAANVYLTDRDFDGNGVYDEIGLIGGIPGMKSVLISRSPTGELGIGYYPETARNYYRPDSLEPTISSDGRYVAFRSLAVNLLPPSVLRSDGIEVTNSYMRSTDIAVNSVIAQFSDYNETEDVYVHDRDPGLTGDPQLFDTADITKSFFRNNVNTRVSVNKFGFQTSGLVGLPNIPASRQPQISPDGRYIVFVSDADNNGGIAFGQTNMEPLDSNQKRDVFFMDRRFTQDPSVDLGFPVSTILSPVIGNTFSTGSSVVITASASDTNRNGSISNVEFYVNGVSIGFYEPSISNTSSGRYSLTWSVPNSTGLLNLYTKVTDNEGNVSTSPVVQVSALVAIGQIPVFGPSKVALSRNPIPVGSSATLSVAVTDADGRIVGVDFLANGQLIGTVTSAPYSLVWSPTVTGVYDIRAIARDNDGNSRSTAEEVLATVAGNIAPSVSIAEPTSEVSVRIGASINLIASASDPDGSIAKAEFFANGASIAVVDNPPMTVATQWTPSAPGDYTISVVVTDDLGVKSTNVESIIVKVQPIVGSAPAVQVSAPAVNSGVAAASIGSQVLFVANATDNTTVTSVKFYADGILLGAAVQQGSSNMWALSKALNGEPFIQKGVGIYLVTALAADSDGNQTQSAPISLSVTSKVSGTAPTGSYVFPTAGSVHTLGQVVNLQASAVDNESAIASVGFYANGEFVANDSSVPFSAEWTPTVAGDYNLNLVILDAQGTTSVTSAVTVSVKPTVGLLPQVTAFAPSISLTTASICEFRALASDPDGANLSVTFMLNNESIGAGVYDSSTGFWHSPKLSFATRGAGSYSLTVIVVDSDANQVTSSPVAFSVAASIVDSTFGVKLNEVFLSLIGRNSSVTEMQDYFDRLGSAALDYEIAAALVQTSVFESSGAIVINAYRAVFGEYPTFSAYQDGLMAINNGVQKAEYIDSLYASKDYLMKFGALPSFASAAAIEKFAGDTHFNLTGVKPSTRKSNKMTASDWGLSVAELDAVLRNRKSELSVIVDRFGDLTSKSVGTVVAEYIESPVGSDKLLQAIQMRARVAGIILSITEPNSAISLRETDGLSSYNLLDVAELYGTGSTDAAIRPIFRVLPSATSVALGAELKLTAIVISSAGWTANEINSKWTYNRSTTLGAGTTVTSAWPVHEFTYTVPAANLANAGTYDFSVTNRSGTASAPSIGVSVSPASPASLPLVISLRVGIPFSIDLGDDRPGMTYVAKSLPAGLRLNSATGVISGTPTKAGSTIVSYNTVLGKVSSPVKRTTFAVSR
jgi:hypothetical protein